MQTVLFACAPGAGRAQMAAAFFNTFAHRSRAHAIAAITRPTRVSCRTVAEVMREAGIELSSDEPRLLTPELAREGTLLVTMDCGDALPEVLHRLREEWCLPEPDGQVVATVRSIRDDVRNRVRLLVQREGWTRTGTSD